MEPTYHPILYVEDNPNDARLFKRALAAAGVCQPVQIVGDGARAVKYLRGLYPFDCRELYPLPALILLNLSTPVVDGLKFLKWRQERPYIQRIPVVVLTSSPRPDDVTAAYESGANSCLIRPLVYADLLAMAKAIQTYWLMHNHFGVPSDGGVSEAREAKATVAVPNPVGMSNMAPNWPRERFADLDSSRPSSRAA